MCQWQANAQARAACKAFNLACPNNASSKQAIRELHLINVAFAHDAGWQAYLL